MKLPPVPTTVLDLDPPLTDEERERFAEEHHKAWFSQTLDRLFIAALGDKELKQAFLDTAKSLAKKPVVGSHSAKTITLLDYAHAVMKYGINDTDRIYERLIEQHEDTYGKRQKLETMVTRVSQASKMALNGELPLFPDPLLDIIEARRGKYKHSEGEGERPEYLKGWGYAEAQKKK